MNRWEGFREIELIELVIGLSQLRIKTLTTNDLINEIKQEGIRRYRKEKASGATYRLCKEDFS